MKALPLWLTLAATALADGDPGRTAVRHLEQVRAGRVALEPGKDTALSPATGADKRRDIEERIGRLAKELGPDPFTVGAIKIDGDLAAVLVRQETPLDPAKLRVDAVALVRRGDNWLPAPAPGSFENTALGYDVDRSKRQAGLTRWMEETRPHELAELRRDARERLRRQVAGSITTGELRDRTPAELARRFLDACQRQDKFAVLGLLGGLAETPPPELAARIPLIDRGLASGGAPETAADGDAPWRWFTAPEIVRVLAQEPDGTVTLTCLDGGKSGKPAFHQISLRFQQGADGLRQLLWPETQPRELPLAEPASGAIRDAIQQTVAALRRDHPVAGRPGAREAAAAFAAAYRSPAAAPPLELLEFPDDPMQAAAGCHKFARLWSRLHPGTTPARLLLPLDLHEEGGEAVAIYQALQPNNPVATDLLRLPFARTRDGWLLAADGKANAAQPWADRACQELAAGWQKQALAGAAALASLPAGDAPAEAAVREVFDRWRQALQSGPIEEAIACTAYLNTPAVTPAGRSGPAGLLGRLAQEWLAARQKDAPGVLGVVRSGRWAGVSVRGGSADADARYRLHPVLMTPAGPRLLEEVDLVAGGDRTRDFLNEAAFSRLAPAGQPDALAELRQLYHLHRQAAEADRARNP